MVADPGNDTQCWVLLKTRERNCNYDRRVWEGKLTCTKHVQREDEARALFERKGTE
jgi:hypothetical protein